MSVRAFGSAVGVTADQDGAEDGGIPEPSPSPASLPGSPAASSTLAPSPATLASPASAASASTAPAASGPPATPAVTAARPRRRAVRVEDFDRLSKQADALKLQGAQLTADFQACSNRTEAVEDNLRSGRVLTQGLEVLRTVARQQEYFLGRALQRVLAMRLVERPRACSARPPVGDRAVAGRARQEQTAIVLEVPFTRSGLDELVAMLSLTHTHVPGRRTARASRMVQFHGAAEVLSALSVPVVPENMCRQFSRKDGSAPARLLVERRVSESCSMIYITGRDAETGDLLVNVRESETYHVRRRCFVHSLKEKRVPKSALAVAPAQSPAFIAWRESAVSASLDGWEDGDACGAVTLSLPCCTMEVLPADVADMVKALTL